MNWLLLFLNLAGLYPWIRAWSAVQKTSLSHAMAWACLAWLSWAAVLSDAEASEPVRYLALCLTACAGIAVLGARRPHVAAWNFVVVGLLAVMTLPLLESLVRDSPIGPVRTGFLAVTLFVVLGNFLPTSLGPAAILAGLGCASEMWRLMAGTETPLAVRWIGEAALTLVPWLGWICWKFRPQPRRQLEREWLDFRDRFGILWSLRVREQFNHAAEHAGWPIMLTWNGSAPRVSDPSATASESEILTDFRALIKRFDARRMSDGST